MNGDNSNDNKTSSGINENSNLVQSKKDIVYHAIYVPLDSEDLIERQVHVYTDKDEAFKAIKKHPSGRLKIFKSQCEAEEYAKHGSEGVNGFSWKIPTITISSEEKTNSFKGPKSQELVAFRKLIEAGNVDAVRKIVWENPRYLISSGDTPAILQEGCRYNALHIASFKGTRNVEMCELILDTVSDPEFVKLHYGKDESKSYVNRAEILLDLYLNTPDKGLNETPLHFAAKYGLKDVVKLLVSYSKCVKILKNKYNQIPMEIVCARKCQDDEFLKREIRMLLEDQYYVPVLRSDDTSIQPEIGEPFSPTSPPRFNEDPLSPKVEVRAFAGPMTKPQAMEFRKKWKTPPRKFGNLTARDVSLNDSYSLISSPGPRHDIIRLKDTEKGLERVGRNLAEEYSVSWKEFWPFLNDFADLRDNEGLALLEKYLKEKVTAMRKNSISNGKKSLMSDIVDELYHIWGKLQTDDENKLNNSISEMDLLTAKMAKCSLNRTESSNSELNDEFYTPPDTPSALDSGESDNDSSDDEMFAAEEGEPVFIEGESPGKLDFAVLNAIPEDINHSEYPFIYQWKHEMKLAASRGDHQSFKTPRRRLLMTPEK